MTSIKVKLRRSSGQERAGALCIQIIHKREIRLLTTDYKVFVFEWNNVEQCVLVNSQVKERAEYLQDLQDKISVEVDYLKNIVQRLKQKGDYSMQQIVDCYKKREFDGYLFAFMNDQIELLQKRGQYKTAMSYKCAMNVFLKFRKGKDIPIEQIDVQLIESFQAYLKSNEVSLNTISYYMRILRANYNKAIESNLYKQSYPFKYAYTGSTKTMKRSVGESAIVALKRVDLSNYETLDYARDLFLFSFYTRGMSFIDNTKVASK